MITFSSSDEEEEEEEEEHYYDYEEEEYTVGKVVSDHEFSPESDLEKDGEDTATPVRRARTAIKGEFYLSFNVLFHFIKESKIR